MKYNTASYKCNESNTIIGYSTKKELPETIERTIDGQLLTLTRQ